MDFRREVVPKIPEEGQKSIVGLSGSDSPLLMTIVGLTGRLMAGAPASKAAGEVTRFPVRIDGEDRIASPIIARDPVFARQREGRTHIREGIAPGGLWQAGTAE